MKVDVTWAPGVMEKFADFCIKNDKSVTDEKVYISDLKRYECERETLVNRGGKGKMRDETIAECGFMEKMRDGIIAKHGLMSEIQRLDFNLDHFLENNNTIFDDSIVKGRSFSDGEKKALIPITKKVFSLFKKLQNLQEYPK